MRGTGLRQLLTLAALALLAACTTPQRASLPSAPPPVDVKRPPTGLAPPPVAVPDAIAAGISAGPEIAALPGWADSDPAPALAAFRKSCRSVTRRADGSGLTRPDEWMVPCTAAATATDPRAFFESQFGTLVVGTGSGLNTGYFEPEIAGARTPTDTAKTPIYRRPPDLVEVDLGLFSEALKGKRVRGRVVGASLIPYFERAEIEDGALAGRGLELGYAVDPHQLFFLHIQGSGRLRLPDGSVMRIGYDSQNGRDYVGIGKRLRELNLLGPGQATMDGILAWLRANPEQGKSLLRENKSYVFLKELTGDGPLGALGVAVTPEISVAADPAFTPLGAPLWLDTMIPEPDASTPKGYVQTPFRRLMVAQDVGGAIKGPNRYDLFWGPGERAAKVAGGLSWTGRTLLLLPKASIARLLADGAQARP